MCIHGLWDVCVCCLFVCFITNIDRFVYVWTFPSSWMFVVVVVVVCILFIIFLCVILFVFLSLFRSYLFNVHNLSYYHYYLFCFVIANVVVLLILFFFLFRFIFILGMVFARLFEAIFFGISFDRDIY